MRPEPGPSGNRGRGRDEILSATDVLYHRSLHPRHGKSHLHVDDLSVDPINPWQKRQVDATSCGPASRDHRWAFTAPAPAAAGDLVTSGAPPCRARDPPQRTDVPPCSRNTRSGVGGPFCRGGLGEGFTPHVWMRVRSRAIGHAGRAERQPLARTHPNAKREPIYDPTSDPGLLTLP